MADILFDRELDSGPPADPPAAWEESATIEVRRSRDWFARSRDYEVFLDDASVALLGRTHPAIYCVRPGWHAISAKMDWCRTEVVAMHLRPGEHVVFLCGLSSPAGRIWKRFFVVTFAAIGIALIGVALERWLPGWKGGWADVAFNRLFVGVFAATAIHLIFAFRPMLPWKPPGSLIALERLDEMPDSPGVRFDASSAYGQ